MQRANEGDHSVSSVAEGAQKHFRVLVIDDNPTDRELAGIHLGRAWPFEHELVLDYAADGQEALNKIHDIRFALIVLDWTMPVMSGEEVLREVRHRGFRIPVIVMSGLNRNAIPADLEALGAVFLSKNDMNQITFHEAIATSLRLLGLGKPTPATTGRI